MLFVKQKASRLSETSQVPGFSFSVSHTALPRMHFFFSFFFKDFENNFGIGNKFKKSNVPGIQPNLFPD